MSKLLHLKASRTRILNTFPGKTFGNDGDIVISTISNKGTYLCTKVNGVWHTLNRMSPLSMVDKIPSNILTKKLRIKDIKSSLGTNKFVVSEGDGELRYRTSSEVLDDLSTDPISINYKTAYCSLNQYNNKEDCWANGGTWYYSENDSHDSISNTAENELLTIGSSIGKIDAESTLTYDGSTLEIKRNSDFDDNWQTSAQNTLLKLSYDSSNNTIIGVNLNGDLTIEPSGGDTTLKNSTLTIGGIAEVGSDTDKILMSDSGVVKYVTGANLRSYIGAGTSSFGGALNDLSDVTYSSGDLTIDSLDTIISGDLTFDSSGDVTIDAAGGDVNITSADVKIDATKRLYLDGGSNTYIHEESADRITFTVGGDDVLELSETGSAGNKIFAGYSAIGFYQWEPTYNASDTEVDFANKGNKSSLTFGAGNITDLNLVFPDMSCNCILLITQDGTGSRLITNYKTFDQSDGNESTVKFAGGTNPTLTTTANKTDIISFYWDNDNHRAYATISYNF